MVAFDHMRLKLSYFEWAYEFMDIYSRLFTNDDNIEAGEAVASKRPSQHMVK